MDLQGKAPATAVAFGPGENKDKGAVAVGHTDGTVTIARLAITKDSKQVASKDFKVSENEIIGIDHGPEGSFMAVQDNTGVLSIIDCKRFDNIRIVRTFEGPVSPILSAIFSDDKKLLFTSTNDGVYIYRIDSGALVWHKGNKRTDGPVAFAIEENGTKVSIRTDRNNVEM
jgi:WD40 repeat protein